MRRKVLPWPTSGWHRRGGPYFTADDVRKIASVVGLKLQHDDAATILNDAARQFLLAYAIDQKHTPPGEVAAAARAIEKAAGDLLCALGLPRDAASGAALSDLQWWHAATGGRGSVPEAADAVILLRAFGERVADAKRGKRGKRRAQPGLNAFVWLMAGAYKDLTGRKPTVSTESEEGRKPIGQAERFGPFVEFMKIAARCIAEKLATEAPEIARALLAWRYRNTLADKWLALSRKIKVEKLPEG